MQQTNKMKYEENETEALKMFVTITNLRNVNSTLNSSINSKIGKKSFPSKVHFINVKQQMKNKIPIRIKKNQGVVLHGR